jgi:hypothetical protein
LDLSRRIFGKSFSWSTTTLDIAFLKRFRVVDVFPSSWSEEQRDANREYVNLSTPCRMCNVGYRRTDRPANLLVVDSIQKLFQ